MPRQPKAGGSSRVRAAALADVLKRGEEAGARLRECVDAARAEGLPNATASRLFRSMVTFVFGPEYQYSAPSAKKPVPSSNSRAHADVREEELVKPVAPKRGRERKRKGSSNSQNKVVPNIAPAIKKPSKKKTNGRRKLKSVTSSSEESAAESPPKKDMEVIEIEDSPAPNDRNVSASQEGSACDSQLPNTSEDVPEALNDDKSVTVGDQRASSDVEDNYSETMRDADDIRFAVGKDGHISKATISRFKGLSSGGSKISVDKASTAQKSNRLFNNGAHTNRIKPPNGKATMMTAGSQTEKRLASKTPGMRKLDFGVGKPPRPDPVAARSIAGSLFPMSSKKMEGASDDAVEEKPKSPEIALKAPETVSNAPAERDMPEILNEDEPKQRDGSTEQQEYVDIQVEIPENNDEDASKEDIVEETAKPIQKKKIASEEPKAEDHGSKYPLEPLFPRGLFDDPTPRPKPKKKSISFAPEVEDLEEKAELAKKRPAQEDNLATNPIKRQRFDVAPQRSELRERIENMRLRFSQKTIDTPARQADDEAPETMDHEQPETSQFPSQSTDDEHTKSSGFYSAKSLQDRIDEANNLHQGSDGFDLRTPVTGTELRPFADLTNSQTPSSIKTPAVALESKFNAASPDDDRVAEVKDKEGDEVMREGLSMKSSGAGPSSSAGDSGVFGNLYTSVKSLLPNSSSLFGFPVDNQSPEVESESAKANRLAEKQRLEDERREAEIIAKREATKAARQAEARAKQRKVEENRKAQEEERRRREEAQKQKEVERVRHLRKQLEERKRVKAENERKREERRKKVLEHQEKVKAAEAAKRADMERRYNMDRALAQANAGSKSTKPGGLAGPSVPGSVKKQRPAAGSSATPTPVRKKSEEVTSYEMSAERDRGTEGDSDSDAEEMAKRKGKKIPEWAQKENVWKALENQTGDPDKHFSRVQSVNLEDVFASTQQNKVRYRSRNSSGQWTKDRLTAKEEMEYKKKAGYI